MFGELNIAILKIRSSCLWVNVLQKIFTDVLRCLPVKFLLSFSSSSFRKMIPLVLKKTEVVHKALHVLVVLAPASVDFPRKVCVRMTKKYLLLGEGAGIIFSFDGIQ